MELRLRTEVNVVPRHDLLPYHRPVLLLGSCFSDNIGSRLLARGFNVSANPLGPVYNPAAMRSQASLLASGRMVAPSETFEHEGMWRHFLTHTLLSRSDRSEAVSAINEAMCRPREILASAEAPLICLTLGTAWVFTLADGSGLTVANCHKLPPARFTRRLLSVGEAASELISTIDLLSEAAPGADFIVTVSPIRHLADGLDGNSLSKAVLRIAADQAVKERGAIYFPAFEAITDDLRDYRFYTPDMKHPTEQAADYIYMLFENAYTDPTTRRMAREALAATKRSAHRQLLNNNPAK